MKSRVLDLDGALVPQRRLLHHQRPLLCPMQHWGPRIRLACSFHRFQRFKNALTERLGTATDHDPCITFFGSGDFHHVTLALLRRLTKPFNLLILDNHPDWMRAVPFLHCGTWVDHAARLPLLRRIYHVGGNTDFDNYYAPLAPWRELRAGKIVVLPAIRTFAGKRWASVWHAPVGAGEDPGWFSSHLQVLLRPFVAQLGRYPLYISVDKDVFTDREATVNWDSGHMTLEEGCAVLSAFTAAAGGQIIGMDVLGDWSPVRVAGLFRRLFHFTMHPPMTVDATLASNRNEHANLRLAGTVDAAAANGFRQIG